MLNLAYLSLHCCWAGFSTFTNLVGCQGIFGPVPPPFWIRNYATKVELKWWKSILLQFIFKFFCYFSLNIKVILPHNLFIRTFTFFIKYNFTWVYILLDGNALRLQLIIYWSHHMEGLHGDIGCWAYRITRACVCYGGKNINLSIGISERGTGGYW